MSCQLGGDGAKDNTRTEGDQQPAGHFRTARGAALALLAADVRLTRKAGSFLGQVAVDPTPLSPAQRDWLDTLLVRAELPPLVDEGRI